MIKTLKATPASPITSLKGAGPGRSAKLERMGLRTVCDLLYFFPRRYEDRRRVTKISELVPGAPSVVFARVVFLETRRLVGNNKLITTCRLTDGTGEMEAVWFNIRGLNRMLCEGAEAALFGMPLFRGSTLQMASPEFAVGAAPEAFAGIVPVYPLTEGLTQKWLRQFTKDTAARFAPLLEERLPASLIEKNNLMPIAAAISQMHVPDSPESWKEARRRLAYEELFTLQAALAAMRAKNSEKNAVKAARGPIYDALMKSLPFTPTSAQTKAIAEIYGDASQGRPMRRLLQGDVGCGKSLVAAAFAAGLCDSGAQTVLLAPTETLAAQLYAEAEKYLAPLGVRCALLTASVKPAARREILAGLADGAIEVAAGTHSLLSEEASFHMLGAAIIDEQQRFGVRQRAALIERAPRAHLLMMSATPIPRTTAQTIYGDLEISVIDEMPPGRTPVATRIITSQQMPELMRFLIKETASGGRTFWICPRVEEDPAAALPAAKKRFEWLVKKLPPIPASLIHGQMDYAEKEAALDKFRAGDAKILVGTTVLEVGVNVPEASVIIIEAPERYGLSQLHQMRGRVGRGKRRGLCVLISDEQPAPSRLSLFAQTTDGFKIAEADLAFRGAGELTGTMQHGAQSFKAADPVKDIDLARQAKEDVDWLIRTEGLGAEKLKALANDAFFEQKENHEA
ncbi:MAG: ATP-dependent DNA helicase RecG [Cloacibacillus sp.]